MVTMRMVASPIGRRVRDLRERRGYTQEELARLAGVPRSWLGLLEIGKIQRPGADRIGMVADALEVEVRYLLSGSQGTGEQPIYAPAEYRSILQNLARVYTPAQLERWERSIHGFFFPRGRTAGQPPDHPGDQDSDQDAGDIRFDDGNRHHA